MCGIAGIFDSKAEGSVDEHTIRRMIDVIEHRGPDGEGIYMDPAAGLGLGHRRLSIIDIEGGQQPMFTADKRLCIVFNGEIYNFPQLRSLLESKGHHFRTHCDTEVILNGYREWGEDVLNHLNGMFAFALWDADARNLFLARDRAGVKNLYYSVDGGRVCFASEIRSLRTLDDGSPSIDRVALNMFLRYRYTPAPYTLIEGIRKLAPGTKLSINAQGVHESRWWRYTPKPFDTTPSPKQAEEALYELYAQAVSRQLISDVPLGLLLSGGMDSALLLALMNQHGSHWKTFTVGFGDSYREDELSEAAYTAQVLESDHVSVHIDRAEFENILPKIVGIVEEPVASASIVPMYFVCERARQDVKVALMGQGPDELIGGYTRHLGTRYGNYWRSIPSGARRLIKSAAAPFLGNDTLRRALYSLDVTDRIKRYQQILSILPEDLIDGLFIENTLPDHAGDTVLDCWKDLFPLMEATDELGGLQFIELRSTLPDELLIYADKLSMAHSLEVRVPYLDHDIIEYVEKLPASLKIRWGKRKWLHKNVCRRYLNKEILNRGKKGFAVNVVDDWFRETTSGKISETLLDHDSSMYAYLRSDIVEQLVLDHQTGKRNNHKILFSLIVLEEWLRSELGTSLPRRTM